MAQRHMIQRHQIATKPALSTFIFKAITPTVLLVGLLLLAIHSFATVFQMAQQQDDSFHNAFAFHKGAFTDIFNHSAGIDRPSILYYRDSLLTYAEWSSTLAINGDVQELWNNEHAYTIDEAHHRIYNTVNGDRWQLSEIITMINDRTTNVAFNFIAKPSSSTSVTHFVFDIVHSHNFWYNDQITRNTFSGQVMLGDPETLQRTQANQRPVLLGTLSLVLQSTLPHMPALIINDDHAVIGATQSWRWARSLTTEYLVDTPPSQHMIELGTETITFQPNSHTANNLISLP